MKRSALTIVISTSILLALSWVGLEGAASAWRGESYVHEAPSTLSSNLIIVAMRNSVFHTAHYVSRVSEPTILLWMGLALIVLGFTVRGRKQE